MGRVLVAVLAVSVVLGGCSHDAASKSASGAPSTPSATASSQPATAILGKWVVDPAVVVDSPKQTPGFMKGFASTFWYEFKASGKFGSSMSEGTYALTGTSIAITTTKAAGQDLHATESQMTGELSADGKKLTLHPKASSMLSLLPDALQHGIPMVKDSGS